MTIITALDHAAKLVRLSADVLEGKIQSPIEIAFGLLDIGLDLVPAEDLREYLTERARLRQDLAFEAAKFAKFGADDD